MAALVDTHYIKGGRENLFRRPELNVDCIQQYILSLPPKIKKFVENKLIGIEIEVEQAAVGFSSPFWAVERDGSLRNHGLEYKTVYPTKVGDLWLALKEYKRWVEESRKEFARAFQSTERCSTHVHVDVRLMDEEDIQKLVAIYVLLEDALFNYCGPDRKQNVFSVPLNSIGLYEMSARDLIQNWDKYSALNLRTIGQFGTVEFRGMVGTDNIEYIMTWTVICALLVVAAELTPKQVLWDMLKDLKTSSDYKKVVKTFLYGFSDLLHWNDDVMDENCTNAKVVLAKGIM